MRLRGGSGLRAALGPAVVIVALTGCGESGDEPAGLDGGPPATEAGAAGDDAEADATDAHGDPGESSDEPTGADTPDSDEGDTPAGGGTHEFPEAGTTVIEPDEVPAEAEVALEVLVEYLREFRWSTREVEMSDRLEDLAVPSLVSEIADSIDYQEQNGIRYDGEIVFQLDIEHSSEYQVIFGGCIDATDLVVVDGDGERPALDEQRGQVVQMSATVSGDGGVWLVSEDIAEEDEPC